MKLAFDFFSIATIIGMCISLFSALVIAAIKKTNANIIFSLFLVSVSITIFGFGVLIKTNLYLYFPHLLKISTPFILLLGPIFLFYIKTLIANKIILNKFSFLHIVPFILIILMTLPFYLKSGQYKIDYFHSILADKTYPSYITYEYVIFLLISIHTSAYLFYSLYMILSYEKTIKNSFSSIDKINLNWLRKFIYLFFGLVIVMILIFILIVFFIKFSFIYMFIPLSVTFVICYLSYKALIQPEILIGIDLKNMNSGSKPKQTVITNIDKYIKILSSAMENDKLYRDPELSLSELALKLNLNRNLLSYIINNYFKMNFYDFINKYRIEDVKNFLTNNNKVKNFNIINVAMNAGFNSKGTFNAIFKKYTNMTPTEYRKKSQIDI
jgi:AraC-like DNA-binding protein